MLLSRMAPSRVSLENSLMESELKLDRIIKMDDLKDSMTTEELKLTIKSIKSYYRGYLHSANSLMEYARKSGSSEERTNLMDDAKLKKEEVNMTINFINGILADRGEIATSLAPSIVSEREVLTPVEEVTTLLEHNHLENRTDDKLEDSFHGGMSPAHDVDDVGPVRPVAPGNSIKGDWEPGKLVKSFCSYRNSNNESRPLNIVSESFTNVGIDSHVKVKPVFEPSNVNIADRHFSRDIDNFDTYDDKVCDDIVTKRADPIKSNLKKHSVRFEDSQPMTSIYQPKSFVAPSFSSHSHTLNNISPHTNSNAVFFPQNDLVAGKSGRSLYNDAAGHTLPPRSHTFSTNVGYDYVGSRDRQSRPYSSQYNSLGNNSNFQQINTVPDSTVGSSFVNRAVSRGKGRALDPSTTHIIKQELFKRPINPFNGDAKAYHSWFASIQSKLNGLDLSAMDILLVMESHTVGEPQRNIKDMIMLGAANPERTLSDVLDYLKNRYGSGQMIADSLTKEVKGLAIIKSEYEISKMEELVSICKLILANMEVAHELNFFNYAQGKRMIFEKLPSRMQDRWQDYDFDYQEKYGGESAPFQELVRFLERTVRRYANPTYQKTASIPNRFVRNEKKIHMYENYLTSTDDPDTPKVENAPNCAIHGMSKHDTNECRDFIQMDLVDRRKVVFDKGLCFLCLGKHMRKDCTSKEGCNECSRLDHHTLLHRNMNTEGSHEKKSLCTGMHDHKDMKTCSKTVLVELSHPATSQKKLRCYCIVDEQSSSCFIDPKVMDYFNINAPVVDYNLNTLNGCKIRTKGNEISGLYVKGVGEKRGFFLPPAMTNSSIPNNKNEIATPACVEMHAHIAYLSKHFNELDPEADILVLMGRDCGRGMWTRSFGNRAPYAHHTALGWALVGATCMPGDQVEERSVFRTTLNHEHFESQRMIVAARDPCTNIYDESSDDEKLGISKDDQRFLDIVSSGIKINEGGQISIPLPFKHGRPDMPDNKLAVFNRTRNCLKRLEKEPTKLDQCVKTMNKYLKAGHVEERHISTLPKDTQKSWWIPVFPVEEIKKGKVRLVFDSSAKYYGKSLNSELLQGPDFTNSLRSVLLKFRLGPIGYSTDIESMFHNFMLEEEDKDYTNFFWYKNNSPAGELVPYRATRHMFGNTSSSSIATYGLRFAINMNKEETSTSVIDFVTHNFYVDDGLASSFSPEEAIHTLKETQKCLKQFNINLHKITSNCSEVTNEFIDDEKRPQQHLLALHDDPVHSTLGVLWDVKNDKFVLKINLPDRPFTKRGLLSTINSIFDPIGIISPIVLAARIVQRKLVPCKNDSEGIFSLDWDDPLPEKYRSEWEGWKLSLMSASGYSIPRCYVTAMFGIPVKQELCAFSDASLNGSGYVIYIKSFNEMGDTNISFVCANSRVPPRKTSSIPRLELCAAVETSLAAKSAADTLKIEDKNVKLYTDSKVVLGYLKNTTKSFTLYITRRINLILKQFPVEQWYFVNTESNPADLASRPQTMTGLKKSMWATGPPFLYNDELVNNISPELDCETLPEEEKENTVLAVSKDEPHGMSKIVDYYSRYKDIIRAVRVVYIYSLNMIDSFKQNKGVNLAIRLHVNNNEVIDLLVKSEQQRFFGSCYQLLQDKNYSLPAKHCLSALSPFIDENGVMRVGGRLRQSHLLINQKFPIIIPAKSNLASVIIRHFHQLNKHQGRVVTMSAIRNEGYFIQHGSKLVSKIISNCMLCCRQRGRFLEQQMAELPMDRIEECPPFTNVGLDVFGPYMITDGVVTRKNASTKKLWAVIFTCLVSRAVHVEPLPCMDTSSFVNALRRFIATRGTCKLIRSDRGTNLVGALNQDTTLSFHDIQDELANTNCRWEMNPPKASHFGGIWERKIGSIKRILEQCLLPLGSRHPTRDEMMTFFQEACAIINNTPLCQITGDPNEPLPISPAMLLSLKGHPNPPPPEMFTVKDVMAYGSRRWRRVQQLADMFWARWRQEYLQDLNRRQKWRLISRNIEKGDIVLLKESNVKRNNWPIGIVYDRKVSVDGLVRSVSLKVIKDGKVSLLQRPISDLVLLIAKE